MEKLNIALIGCGGIAGNHVNGYRDLHIQDLRVFEIKAVCDVSTENAKAKSETIGRFQRDTPKIYTDIDAMLKEESPDAVDVCLPHNVQNHLKRPV